MTPKVSVCFISWNHAKFIEQSIESLINQKFKDFEVIYLDNASTDGTFEKAQRALLKLNVPTFLFKNLEPKGTSENVNFLYNKVRCEYIANLSGDDWWHPDHLEQKIKYYENHPELGLLYGGGWFYYNDLNKYQEVPTSKFRRGWVFDELLKENFIFAIGFIMKKAVFDKVGPWDTNTQLEDWDMWLRIAKEYPVDFIETPLAYYRRHSNNYSSDKNFEENCFEQIKVIEKYKSYKNYAKGKKKLIDELIYHKAHYSPSLQNLFFILKNSKPGVFYFKQIFKTIYLLGTNSIKNLFQKRSEAFKDSL